jgi:hypothetical protein
MFEYPNYKAMRRRTFFFSVLGIAGAAAGNQAFAFMNNNPAFDIQAMLEQNDAREAVARAEHESQLNSRFVMLRYKGEGEHPDVFAARRIDGYVPQGQQPYLVASEYTDWGVRSSVERSKPGSFRLDTEGSCWDLEARGYRLVNISGEKAADDLVKASDWLLGKPFTPEQAAGIVGNARAVFSDPQNRENLYQLVPSGNGQVRAAAVVPSKTGSDSRGFACSGDRGANPQEVVPAIPTRGGGYRWE